MTPEQIHKLEELALYADRAANGDERLPHQEDVLKDIRDELRAIVAAIAQNGKE